MHNSKYDFQTYISLVNSIILTLYILNFDLPTGSWLFDILVITLLVSFLSIFRSRFKNFFFRLMNIFQLPILTIILFFLVLETVFYFNQSIFPNNLKIWIDKKGNNIQVIEYLEDSPYIKFKPNTDVKIRFYRGNVNQFQYSWRTDSKGFKNNDTLANLKTVDVVAIGDSFTEGMGVSKNETYPGILNKKGFLTYNLGVQGYSPTQALGSLQQFGSKLMPKFIIAQYTINTYKREKFFLDKENISFTGGIGHINAAQINPEIRNQAKYIFSAVWLMTKNIRNFLSKKIKFNHIRLKNEKFEPYKYLVNIKDYNTAPVNKKLWDVTLQAFKDMNDVANEIGAKFILLYIPTRSIVYYEKAMGEETPPMVFNETNTLREFAENNNFTYIDPTKKLIEYVNDLPENFKLDQLPFLIVDSHMNKIGYDIISEEIIKELK